MKPTNFDNLKTPKTGYQWVSRGKGWNNDDEKSASYGACNDGIWKYYENNDPMGWAGTEYAELVLIDRPSLEEQIKLAKSMVGKEFIWGDSPFKATEWKITNSLSSRVHSGSVYDEVAEFGVCVYLQSVGGMQCPVLCEDLIEVIKPKFIEVTLNGTYNAKVYEDKIEVGCQTFPISILEDLVKASREISNQ
jgi:hypothetical protein